MASKLSVKQMDGRYEALAEASQHLKLLDWTDVPSERQEGLMMAEWLQKEAVKWLRKANVAREAQEKQGKQ